MEFGVLIERLLLHYVKQSNPSKYFRCPIHASKRNSMLLIAFRSKIIFLRWWSIEAHTKCPSIIAQREKLLIRFSIFSLGSFCRRLWRWWIALSEMFEAFYVGRLRSICWSMLLKVKLPRKVHGKLDDRDIDMSNDSIRNEEDSPKFGGKWVTDN